MGGKVNMCFKNSDEKIISETGRINGKEGIQKEKTDLEKGDGLSFNYKHL